MGAGGGDLAHGPEPVERRAAVGVRQHPAHVIVRRGRDRDRRFQRVDARFLAGGENGREAYGELLHGAHVEEGAAAGCDLGENPARHHVAGRKLRGGIDFQHEALAGFVDEDRALPAQRLGGERGRIAPHVERGRMELHELGVGDHRAGACRSGQPPPLGFARIGGDRIEPAEAARGQHHGAGRDGDRLGVSPRRPRRDAGDIAAVGQQIVHDDPFEHADRRRLAHGGDQRGHDRGAGPVALHAHDAAARVRGLAREQEAALLVAVERNAVAEQILDARRGLARDQLGDVAVDDAGAGGDRILDVGVDRIVGTERGGDAALGAGGRSALADRRRGDHGDGARRQLQRAEQSRQAAADDDDIVDPAPGFGGEEVLLGGVGHLARHSGARAKLAISESIVSDLRVSIGKPAVMDSGQRRYAPLPE